MFIFDKTKYHSNYLSYPDFTVAPGQKYDRPKLPQKHSLILFQPLMLYLWVGRLLISGSREEL